VAEQEDPVLVIGAIGQQGGAAARGLPCTDHAAMRQMNLISPRCGLSILI
jgi:hypothetical protein